MAGTPERVYRFPLYLLYDSENARRFPGLGALDFREQLVVVSDEGDVYQDYFAWIICLYAPREYREWSQRLAHPALLPLAPFVRVGFCKPTLAL